MFTFINHVLLVFVQIIIFLTKEMLLLFKSWPFITLLICILFRSQFKDLLGRIKKVEAGENNIQFEPQKQDEKGVINVAQNKDSSDLPPIPETIFKKPLEDTITKIKQWLNNFNNNQTDILTRELASCQLALEYERIYQFIFKSQLELLQQLNLVFNGLKRDVLINQFKTLQNIYPVYQNQTLDNWTMFLFLNTLITEKDNVFYITHTGKAFLTYIAERNYRIEIKTL